MDHGRLEVGRTHLPVALVGEEALLRRTIEEHEREDAVAAWIDAAQHLRHDEEVVAKAADNIDMLRF